MKLYTEKILKLATEIPLMGKIDNADKTVSLRSPICGSAITVYINKNQGRIKEFRQEVKACALGQASASILAKNIIGLDLPKISALHNSVKGMLEKTLPAPAPPFSNYELLRPATDFKNRHASILLVLEATKNALQEN